MIVSQKLLDRIERVALVGMWAYFLVAIVQSVAHSHRFYDLLILGVETLTVALVLLRRGASSISTSSSDWILAFGASLTPLLVRPVAADATGLVSLGTVLMLTSIAMQFGSKLTLGRSFGVVPARREIVVRGPYKLVRHPIYASYLIGHAGFLMINPSLWNACIYAIATSLQIARLLREERLLSESPQYEAYLSQVRYRLVPGLF